MLKWTWSRAKDSRLLSALTAAVLQLLILELRDVMYYIHQWIVKQLFCCAANRNDWLVSPLTSHLATASPSPPSFSSFLPSHCPTNGSDHSSHQVTYTILARSDASWFSGQKTCFVLILYSSATVSFALHSSKSGHKIISFSVKVAKWTALSFYFTLHLRWRGKHNRIQWQLKLPASCLKFYLILSH